MTSEWSEVELSDLISVKHGYAFKGEYFSDVPTSFQLVTPGNFAIGGGFQLGKGKFYSGPIPEDYVLRKGNVVVTMTDLSKAADTLGYSAKIPTTQGITWLHNQRVGLVEIRPGVDVCLDFIHYVMRSGDYRHWVLAGATGSTVKHTAPSRLCSYRFKLPPPIQQVAIAEILGALDDRITLLRETNATFAAIAEALFKSWFVDFDPVRAKSEGRFPEGMDEATASLFSDEFEESELGIVPRGWLVATVESISQKIGMGPFGSNIKVETFVSQGVPVISGQHLKKNLVEDLTFNYITDEHAKKLANSCVVAGDVIFTHAGSIGQVSLLHASARFEKYVLSQRQFFLRCDTAKMRPEWMTYFFRSPLGQHLILANASQVGVPSIARPVSYLRSIKLVMPPLPLIERFAGISNTMHGNILANRERISNLVALRDVLLPRLISGQLRFPTVEKKIEIIAA